MQVNFTSIAWNVLWNIVKTTPSAVHIDQTVYRVTVTTNRTFSLDCSPNEGKHKQEDMKIHLAGLMDRSESRLK